MISTTSTSSIISVYRLSLIHWIFASNNSIIVTFILLPVPKTTKWYPALTVWKPFWLRGFCRCELIPVSHPVKEAKVTSLSVAHKWFVTPLLCGVPAVSLFCISPEWSPQPSLWMKRSFLSIWALECKRFDRKLTWMNDKVWSFTTDENYYNCWCDEDPTGSWS